LSMGQTAENLAYQFDISREAMDLFALTSHQRLAKAMDDGLMGEIETAFDTDGKFYDGDTGLRRDTSLEKLATLKPIFDKRYGVVTAGNSSQVTDGAAMLLLASADAAKKFRLPVIGKIKDVNWAGLAPEVMGLGPVHAIPPLLKRANLEPSDIDYWEINEAFAAQVLACLAAFQDKAYCKTHLGRAKTFPEIDPDRLNVFGGAICIGHPIGATGARLVIHLLNILKQKNARRGVASMCIGGGQGGAVLLESLSEVESA